MKFPESWLREHVTVSASQSELAATLTAIGLEVEELEAIGGGLSGVVVGEIVAARPHPEADRLQVCEVDIGQPDRLQIVCGAPNARVGLKAPLAMIGATLPGGMQIKAAKLRGMDSSGMLCSAKEIGTDSDASGLFELPADAANGQPVSELMQLPDARLELKLTPNRADCFSIRGIAYDVAAALGSSVNPMKLEAVPAASDAARAIDTPDAKDCPRYLGRIIEGVDAAASSPLWMRERLRRAGVRPISLLVDITQYVMLELGQPMHAFDADTLSGPISVRRARSGERLTLLDGREVTLDPEFLLIADRDQPVALAGLMGGLATRVTESSRNIFLEAAHFVPEAIVGRSRKLGMHTDASHRFERGVDPALPALAIERATALILEFGGGTPGPVVVAGKAQPDALSPVTLRRARLTRVLGKSIDDSEVSRILNALGMQVEADEQGWQVTPPSRRFDIAIEEDLIEEIARIHGYDRIPLTAPTGQIQLQPVPEQRVAAALVRQQMASRGFFEAINFAFLDKALLQDWNLDQNAVALANPLSSELGVMRTSLLPGLVAALGRNLARQQSRVRLFEIGRCFRASDDAPVETQRLAAVACGSAAMEQWSSDRRGVDFYDLKGDLQSIRALTGQNDLQFDTAQCEPWLHPGRSARVTLDDRTVGWLGQLHPRLQKSLDIDVDLIAFEVDLPPLLERPLPRASELSKFPSIRRDLALVVEESVEFAAIDRSIKGALGARLQQIKVFDRYTGKGLETGCKSLAIGLILQDVSRTLTDEDADRAVADALAALSRDCGARLR